MIMNNENYIIVDSSILIYGHYFVQKKHNNKISTKSIAKLVINQIENLRLSFFNHKIIIAADTPKSKNFRHSINSSYKAHRKHDIDISKIINRLKKEYTVLQFENLEADDIIFLYTYKYENGTVITKDKDLILCLENNNTLYYNIKDKEFTFYSAKDLDYLKYKKIISGDTSDNIQGVKNKRINVMQSHYNMHRHKQKDLKHFLLKTHMHTDLLKQHYFENYELLTYDFDTYYKYIQNFKKLYTSL